MDRKMTLEALEKVYSFIHEDAGYFLRDEQISALKEQVQELIGKAKEPAEVLYIGLVGGTGVGKSTLINAIAGKEISRSSDRRPYTNRAVVYRHREKDRGLEDLEEYVHHTDPTHEIDHIKDLVLIDLPDFDSMDESHKEVAESFIPALDCVIWVTSPQKYADGAFYKLLNKTHKHKDNFTFVLNKADELALEGDNDPLREVREVWAAFMMRIKQEANISSPRMFCVSAKASFEGTPQPSFLQGEFNEFINFLMVRRDEKEIASLKTKNLVEASGAMIKDMKTMLAPERKLQMVKSLISMIENEASHWANVEMETPEHSKELASKILRGLSDCDGAIPSVKLAQGLVLRLKGKKSLETQNRLKETFDMIALDISRAATENLQNVMARFDSELIMSFENIRGSDTETEIANELEKSINGVRFWLVSEIDLVCGKLMGFYSFIRRGWQRLLLAIPVVLLLMSLMDDRETTFQGLAANPLSIPPFLLDLLKSIFSPEALSGIYVLIIIEILLILRMATVRIKKLERLSMSIAMSAIKKLIRAYQETENTIKEHKLKQLKALEKGLEKIQHAKLQ